tara:strand:- start:1579 stop:1872 length:294 start_codon:yes stop_codon:yes gene_type:complete
MKYTKSELGSETGDALLDAIIQIGKELDKKNPPRTRTLAKRLLSNFNKYDKDQLSKMFREFQRLLEECVKCEEDVLDLDYVVEHNLTSVKRIIMSES